MRMIGIGAVFAVLTMVFKADADAGQLAFGFLIGCLASPALMHTVHRVFPVPPEATANKPQEIEFLDEKKPEESPFDSRSGIEEYLDRRWQERERLERDRRDQEERNR